MNTLSELVGTVGVGEVRGADAVVSGATHDSRRVGSGDLFVCISGGRFDGHDLVADASAAGASAALVSRWVDDPLPQILVDDTLAWAGPFASAVYGHPSASMRVVGITGTNGKTTTTYLLEAIASAAGRSAGLIGNIHARLDGVDINTGRTTNTPEAVDLQRILAAMRDAGGDVIATEVTSQGLDRHRVRGTRYAAVGFSNLSQDHLDWHGDMENYYKSKKALFSSDYSPVAAINVSDEWGARLAGEVGIDVLRVGDDVRASNVVMASDHTVIDLVTPDGAATLRSNLVGGFNVENVLLASGLAHLLGFGPDEIASGIEAVDRVAGRLETIDVGRDFSVVVDYAHTPDAVVTVLTAVREFASGRVICVVGCGGDRDTTKRPLMGEAATNNSDLTVITSDNPRTEDPEAILDQVEEGAKRGSGPYLRICDRRAAIAEAFAQASAGDVVVIAGKGHETGQEVNGVVHPFDDRVVAVELGREL